MDGLTDGQAEVKRGDLDPKKENVRLWEWDGVEGWDGMVAVV